MSHVVSHAVMADNVPVSGAHQLLTAKNAHACLVAS